MSGPEDDPRFNGDDTDGLEAYYAGRECAERGGTEKDNPHPVGTPYWQYWLNGFSSEAN